MNPLIRKFLVITVLALIFFEFGYQYFQAGKRAEEQSDITKDGQIKEGREVPFEVEKELAVNSFPNITEREYASEMLFSISQCMIHAQSMGENGYICISNNVSDEAIDGLAELNTDIERGQFILENFFGSKRITDVKVLPESNDSKEFEHTLRVSLNFDAEIIFLRVIVSDRKIVYLEKRDKR